MTAMICRFNFHILSTDPFPISKPWLTRNEEATKNSKSEFKGA